MAEETISPMVDQALGAGGPGVTPETDSLRIDLDEAPELPLGIELDTGEEAPVITEQYVHNANLAEIMEEGALASLAS